MQIIRLAAKAAIITVSVLAATLSGRASAEGFPDRPVKIVVPFAAGGTTDVAARKLAELLRVRWNQGVIIENRVGAGTIIATLAVARSAPDGYTMLLTDSALATNEVLHSKLPYKLETQLAPVTTFVTWALGIAVSTNLGVDSLKGLVELSKTRNLNYGSFGPGTTPHLGMELFKSLSGAQVAHVPFGGVAPVLVAMGSDTVQATIMGAGAALPSVTAGSVRMLALDAKSPLMPDVPTFAEAGFPAMRAPAWWGVAVPGGTPPGIVARLNADIAAALKEPSLHDFLVQNGYVPVGDSPADFAARIKETIELYRPIAKAANIHLD
jgi:tripartite-type tricarboxylate transporter receptor subunit TctC